MSHEPPVPEHNQSPYPIDEPPHQPRDHAEIGSEGGDDNANSSIADRASAFLHDVPSLTGRSVIGVGAAIALGVAATVGALLFSKRKPATTPRRGARKTATARAPRKPAQPRVRKSTAKS